MIKIAASVALALGVAGFATYRSQHRPPMELVVESKLSFDATVEAVKAASEAEKYAVQHVHTVSKVLESKGFKREPLTIIEVCNAKQASTVLANDVRAGLMIPCPIMVYQLGDKVFVSTFDTKIISMFYEGKDMPQVGKDVFASLTKILDSVKK